MSGSDGYKVRKVFADNVKQEMKDGEWTVDDLSERTGLAEDAIERILNAQAFTSGIVEKVSAAFDLDYWVLLVEESEK